jgi:hypothetical protein
VRMRLGRPALPGQDRLKPGHQTPAALGVRLRLAG